MKTLTFDRPINLPVLDQEITRAIGRAHFYGLSNGDSGCLVHLADEVTADEEKQIAAIVEAHELTPLSAIDPLAILQARIAQLEQMLAEQTSDRRTNNATSR